MHQNNKPNSPNAINTKKWNKIEFWQDFRMHLITSSVDREVRPNFVIHVSSYLFLDFIISSHNFLIQWVRPASLIVFNVLRNTIKCISLYLSPMLCDVIPTVTREGVLMCSISNWSNSTYILNYWIHISYQTFLGLATYTNLIAMWLITTALPELFLVLHWLQDSCNVYIYKCIYIYKYAHSMACNDCLLSLVVIFIRLTLQSSRDTYFEYS